MSLVSVSEAQKIVLANIRSWGIEHLPFDKCMGRVLAEDIVADRDLPPYNRVTMDGIAIRHEVFASGQRVFRIKATMAAGDTPVNIEHDNECIELMTGCAVPPTTDTIIRYEDVEINNGAATVRCSELRKGINIHRTGTDRPKGAVVVAKKTVIDATVVNMAASVGQGMVAAKKLPRVVVISTGDELVPVHETPTAYQVRMSNSHAIKAALQPLGVDAHLLHIADDADTTKQHISRCLEVYDVLILSGGVSMGKFDYVPQSMDALGVTKLFHKVMQRPGKPFWFGSHGASGAVVFAFPGNPVSAFMCTYRYLLPWLHASLQAGPQNEAFAALATSLTFTPQLQYFLQVQVSSNSNGQLVAAPLTGNGSGDFANLTEANAFMELPAEINEFRQGDVYRIWPFKAII